MQKRISNFIAKKYLCSVCCTENDKPWANAFYYVFDQENLRLIYVTSDQTHHGQVTLRNPNVAGTIFTPTRFNPSLQGVQFTGIARRLEGDDAEIARALYKKEYHHEIIDQLPVWAIALEYVRMIDHSLGFFGTVEWKLGEPEEETFKELV
ncbi:hypothetical protein BMT54_08725 [Pasteurellaceae bacterium 15-036681]|nr:hypothetical protein BMT54_08725 [Pasteurellaceae bacterium 15-036681]